MAHVSTEAPAERGVAAPAVGGATSRRKKIQEMEVVVTDVVPETPDTVTLVLATEGSWPEYRAGQFCTIDPRQFDAIARFAAYLEEQKGKREPVRAYSLCSAPYEPQVAITVKEEPYIPGVTRYPALLSPWLVRQAPPGTRMVISGFAGAYVLPEDLDERTDHLVHVVAGSGAVPNFAMLKDSLQRGRRLRHTFISSNKTWADICFRKELERLQRAYPDRLRVVHTLTREEDRGFFGPDVRKGRVSLELFRELIPDSGSCMVYVCGPAISPWDRKAAREQGVPLTPRFMEATISHLRELGVEDTRIHRESYG